MDKHVTDAAVDNLFDMFLVQHGLALHDDLVTLDRYHFAGVLVHEVLYPALQDAGSELASDIFLEAGLRHLHVLCQIEDLEDVLVVLETDGTQQGRYGQFLLTVDVSIHHVVDVGGKLYPRALEGDNTCAVELRTVGMHA